MLLLITAITYVATLRFDFVYDDFPQIAYNPFLKTWRYVPQFFVSSVWKQMSPLSPGSYYRPLFLLFSRVVYTVFSDRAPGWHLAALAMHLLVTWLTFLLIKKMTGQFTTAWLAALIFGLHPIHHEVIAWVSGMTESLFAVFFLLAFLAYLRSLEGPKALWVTLSCVFYALALLSKETAFVLPALIFADAWIRYAPEEKQSGPNRASRFRGAFNTAAPFLPIAILYLLVRYKVLSGLGHPAVHISTVTWLLTLPSLLLFYVKHWFFPIHFAEWYDVFYQRNLNLAGVLLPLAIVIALGVVVWRLRNRLGAKEVGYAVAWIVIPLLPALDLFLFGPDELVHDRYFYVPSIGAALLVALVIERAAKTTLDKSKLELFGQPLRAVVAGFLLAIVLAFFGGQAARYWSTDYNLFTRAQQIAPLNPTATNNLGAVLISRREFDRAQDLLEAAYKVQPLDFRFPLNLGRVYYREGQYPKAEGFMLQAKALNPDLAETYVYLAEVELKQGRAKEAQENLQRAVELNPYSAPFHTGYGVVLALNGDCPDAQRQFQAALDLNPGDPYATLQLYRCRAALAPAAPPSTKPGQP